MKCLISSVYCIHWALPSIEERQLFANEESSELEPVRLFASKNPLVSDFADRCVLSSQSSER